MTQELTNTFNDGLVGDLNPLTTPSNVLTDCLNGTFITYNGNEFVLQNDMGNSEIGTAKLPVGYIPVGMKEHGGIIYVASHNPITKKSQIGSFPSPQQLFTGEDLNVAEINFDFRELVDGNPIPYINKEYYRIKLFTDKQSGLARVFHPGDKFIIKSSSISQEIKEAYSNGVIQFKLGVVTNSGNIEYLEDSKLRVYGSTDGFWIFYTQNKSIEEILKDPSKIQIYNAKTSGELVLIIELKTIKAFNLLRKYSFSGDTKTVTFEGEIVSDVPSLNGSTLENSNLGLLSDSNPQTVVSTVSLGSSEASSGKMEYNISPVTVYGVLDRLKKSGIIDFNNIKPQSDISNEWRYYITDTYIKIGWSYDYFNIDQEQYITKIRFTFLDFAMNLSNVNKSDLDNNNGSYHVDLIKDYYNGSFEEIFAFDNSLKKNYIYIVRIDRYINNNGVETKLSNPFYRLLYTGTYFNDYYSESTDYNTLPQKTEILSFDTNISVTAKNPSVYTYKIKTNNDSTFTEKEPNVNDFRIVSEQEISNIGSLKYVVKKQGIYNLEASINSQFNFQNKYAGTISDPSILQSTINNKATFRISKIDHSNASFNKQSELINDPDMNLSSVYSQFTGSGNTRKATVTLDRSIISKAGSVRNDSYQIDSLSPVYYKDIDSTSENRILGFKYVDGGLLAIAGTEDRLRYNSIYYKPGSYTLGTQPGGGDDKSLLDCNINMGNPMVNLVFGYKGQGASLRIEGHNRRGPSDLNGWGWAEEKNEVDKGDDFLIACWRTIKGNIRFINLGSRRTETTNIGSSNIIRTDLMLKCYLSQMLIVQKKTISGYLVGADSNNYVYYKPFDSKIIVEGSFPSYSTNVNFKLGDKDIQTQMNQWSSLLGLKNNLPIFKISLDIIPAFTKEIQLGSEIDFESDFSVLNCYTNAYSYSSSKLSTEYDSNKIYLGQPTGVADSNGIMPLKKDANGLYISRSDDSNIYDWYNRKSAMPLPINSMFSLVENEQGFKEILAIEDDGVITKAEGKWLEGKDSHAPDMLIKIHFGNSKLFE